MIYCVATCVWLLSFNILFLSFINAVALLYSFYGRLQSIVWIYYILLIKSFLAIHLGCSHPFWPLQKVLLWIFLYMYLSQFRSVSQSCLTLWDPMACSTPGFPVLHYLLKFLQTHVHWVSDPIQLSHPLLSPSPPAFSLSQGQGLFQWVGSLHQVAKVLELQL